MLIAGGERPKDGRYQCIECGNVVTVDGDVDELPLCPCCGNEIFQEVV